MSSNRNLTDLLTPGAGTGRAMRTRDATLVLDDLYGASSLSDDVSKLEGRSVILLTGDQLSTAAALIEIDGVARRLVLCPPDLERKHLGAVIRDAEVDALVHSDTEAPPTEAGGMLQMRCSLRLKPRGPVERRFATEWILLTSGTTGDPKMVVHTLKTLTAPIHDVSAPQLIQNWATFYDIRRYGGLQIFMRATSGLGSLVLRSGDEPSEDFLARAAKANITHISGTPSHWRLGLMDPAARRINPDYVRLSGEVADEGILKALKGQYPRARVVHAFATTEAGVGFEVDDGEPGFPASFIIVGNNRVAMKIVEGSLRIRSECASLRYLGADPPPLRDDDGFVDTGDMIELKGDRYYFLGRRGGIINVGGYKVNPEEVEEVINKHASVRMSLVKGRKNPITGALVAADVVLKDGVAEEPALKQQIIAECAASLAPFKVPVLVRFVPSLAMTAGGKLARS